MRWDTLFTELGRDFDDRTTPGLTQANPQGQPKASPTLDRDVIMTIARLKALGEAIALDMRSGRQMILNIRSVGVDWVSGSSPHHPHSQMIVPLHSLTSVLTAEAGEGALAVSAPTVTLSEALRVWSRHTPQLAVSSATQEFVGRLRGSGVDYLDLDAPRAGPRGVVRRIRLAAIEFMTSVE